MEIAYYFQNGLYLNITNRCPTSCVFCFKRGRSWDFHGSNLRLRGGEPSPAELERAVRGSLGKRPVRELVFCGLGESTYRLQVVRQIGALSKSLAPGVWRRLNTIGLGNLIWGRDIVPELAACIDAVSVSLNTADPRQWAELHSPRKGFREKGFQSVLDFVSSCAKAGLKTTVTAIERKGVDLDAVQRLSASLGADFRARPELGASGLGA
ncbi:MAG: radical SAM protein [Elusimicrobia bacterium]|nr:radical SAM protein [Elusimicrobiota bacterium]